MNRARIAIPVAVAAAVLLASCDQHADHHEHHDRPDDALIDAEKANKIDCAPTPATGYVSGASRSISVVHVDGKPAELATAEAYHLMQREAAREGVHIRVVSGFRTQAEQQYLYSCYTNCSCNNCNLAAYPGYSNHQSGIALDLNTHAPGVLSFLRRRGQAFGFFETVPSEDWHWEFHGPSPGAGPCSGGDSGGSGGSGDSRGATASTDLQFRDLTPGGWYRNGIWLKVDAANTDVHHVRYFVDGWFVGASEHPDDGFGARVTLNQLGTRTFVAIAYDRENRPLSEAEVAIKVTEGDTIPGELNLNLEDDGWYTNGVWMKTEATPPGTARVLWSAGRHALGESTDAGQGFAVRQTLSQPGWRVLTARALDAQGRELRRRDVVVKVVD